MHEKKINLAFFCVHLLHFYAKINAYIYQLNQGMH